MAIKARAQITISKVIDIYACYRYYKLQSSTLAKPSKPTTNPPSGWSDTEPAYVSGSTNTLYFVDCNVYSDKSFSFSEVSKSSSYEAAKDAWNKANNAQNSVDNLEIGGRNLLHNSAFLSDDLSKYDNRGDIHLSIDKDGYNNHRSLKAIFNTAGTIGTDITMCVTSSDDGCCDINTTYIFSGWAKALSATTLAARFGWGATNNKFDIGTEWTRFSIIVKSGATNGWHLTTYITTATTIYFSDIKLEKGNKATDWTPAPEDNIAKVDVEYYLSTSATSLSGGSWSTTAPTWVNGKYMWSRTVTVDGAGNKTYSPNQNGVCIAGAKGDKGATGETGPQGPQGGTGPTGKGVSSIVEQYYKSTSATELSGGAWSTTYPGWENGKYIWTRSIITYTDKNSTTTTPVCVTGTKGNTGAKGDKGETGPQGPQGVQGVKGADGKTYYTWIKYADSPTSGISDNPSGKKYIGVAYNKTTATESTTYSDYSWSLIKGDKGDKGDKGETGGTGPTGPTGNGIKSITYYYARTTSQTAPSTASITATSMPTLDATNKYLWQKEVITYTNNTSQTSVLLLAVYGNTGAKGDKGDTGPAGKGISSTEVTYQASTSGTSIPKGTWATSIPSVAAGSYLWTRTIITYTDETSTTSYAVGKMGNTGATGKGIKSTSITYQAHSNGTTAPTGTWTDLVPTTSAEKPYLWSRTILTYTDNTTSTTYSVGSTPDGVLDEIKKVLRYDDTKITLGRTGTGITLNLQNTDIVITDGKVDLMSIGVRTEESDGTTWTVTSLFSDQKLYLGAVNDVSISSSKILQLKSFEGGITFDVQSYQGRGQPIKFYKGVNFDKGWTQDIPTYDAGDCNSITESGYYYIGSKGTNRPENTSGWLECMKYSTNYCAQTYTTYNGKKYTRYQQNGSWGKWGRVWQSYQLFGNESQAMYTDINLSDSAANYDMLEIFYKSNDAPQNNVRIYSPNGKKVDLTSTTYIASSYHYLFVKSKQVVINDKKITTFKHSTYGYCTGEMEIRNGNTTIGKYADNVGIIRVLGWR